MAESRTLIGVESGAIAEPNPGGASKPQRRGIETRGRLLDVAEELFAERGFSGASLRDIGKRLRMPNSSLLYHFPTKTKIYVAVLKRVAKSLEAAVQTATEGRGDEKKRMLALWDALVDWHLDYPRHARIVMRELLDNADRAAEVHRWYLADALLAMGELIKQGQRRRLFRRCDPAAFVLHMLGSISYFFAALPTAAGILVSSPDALKRSYRKEVRTLLRRSLFAGASG